MTELKNLEVELSRFRTRLWAAAGFVLFCFGLLVFRLLVLQVVRHDELATQAENNRIAVVPIVPNRGLIVDRNGVVLANNYSAYTLEITPSKVENLEATIDELATFIDIQPRDRRRFKRLREESKRFESIPIRTRLTDEEVAKFTAQRFRFPGVEVQARLFRHYPYGELASHVLGYIGRINQKEKEAIEDWPEEDQANYRGTDYIGKLGIEQAYERDLHGITGFEEVETSAGGRAVRRLRSNPATPGNTLHLAIDIKLQHLIERLFGGRRGALVAIDPRNGEVLAFVSKPTFDPNLFVDGIDSDSWRELNESMDKPLLNRALRGTYPPGSTYKPFMALAALNTGKRSPSTVIMDNGVFLFGGHRFRSPENEKGGAMNMRRSIVESSNVYYYSLANELGVDTIHSQMSPLGFGRLTGIDLQGEVKGILPSTEWKRKAYRRPEQKKWYAGETISLGIGQGYNTFTMLQVASALSTLVADGQRFEPRVVREVEDVVTRQRRIVSGQALPPLPLKPEHTAIIREAMHGVTTEGTGTRVFAGATYLSGGKTGTAQAVTLRQNEKYNASKMAEYQRDHSLYEAFAPVDQPRVALAVIVENAGFGAQSAAPIARRVLDYLLAGIYPSEEDIVEVSQGRGIAPIGVSRRVADVPLPRGTDAFGSDVTDPTYTEQPGLGPMPVRAASSAQGASAPMEAASAASAAQGASAPVAASAVTTAAVEPLRAPSSPRPSTPWVAAGASAPASTPTRAPGARP
ncbi:penicillin-binding protein 2 [Aquabacterium lacunae]|uniref:Peptidoglycan D,D-transpeptidase MrdA n=1 Tax=Aquabacterium lacunae TaxID=2528630 RepID=A0A4Q9H3N9_9BURK|nr:penicillin-binding protein 2 [Aquabacterium lacunae]TBO29329.1 penicillin-binding protein 2 [Aquabacterium lacunae]